MNPSKEAEIKFAEVLAAYEILSDPKSRAQHDISRRQGAQYDTKRGRADPFGGGGNSGNAWWKSTGGTSAGGAWAGGSGPYNASPSGRARRGSPAGRTRGEATGGQTRGETKVRAWRLHIFKYRRDVYGDGLRGVDMETGFSRSGFSENFGPEGIMEW